TYENHSVKGEKKAYGQCGRNACGGAHRCTPSIRQWTKTDITLCLRMKSEEPHTSHRCHQKLTNEIGFRLRICRVRLPRLRQFTRPWAVRDLSPRRGCYSGA